MIDAIPLACASAALLSLMWIGRADTLRATAFRLTVPAAICAIGIGAGLLSGSASDPVLVLVLTGVGVVLVPLAALLVPPVRRS